MCGIIGHIKSQGIINEVLFNQMRDTLAHRGPDGKGSFFNVNQNIALGHRRLSFLDLSEKGKQPFSNSNKTIHLSFNGEIYNYLELKEELKETYQFQTSTDTEVIIAAYEKWGMDCLNYFKGMFAFALLDENINQLFLARDRFGIKPLYYYQKDKHIIFASEIKGILASGIVKKDIDFSSMCDFFVYRYIPSPKTIWQNIKKVSPAHYLKIDCNSLQVEEKEYWKLTTENNKVKEEELIQNIHQILNKSIKEHARADVPIGSFLSGGYDSSAIVSYLKKQDKNPDTFSIGFDKWERSEDNFAQIVAKHLDLKNKSVIANEDSLDLIELMPEVYDEPIADISIIPTYMVSHLAKNNVKAVMSGEGADELFGGYTWQKDFYNKNYPNDLFSKIKAFFNNEDTVDYYAQAMAMGWFDANELKKMLQPHLHQFIPKDVHWFYRKHYKDDFSPLKSIQYMDMKCFMGELVLTKVDRASMANSLEVRVPFLDHYLFETIFSTREKKYYKKNITKYLLFENIKNELPKVILDRQKQGFVGPDNYYMNKDWYRKQFKNSILIEQNVIKKSYIDSLLNQDYDWRIWKILVLEKWFKYWYE